VLTASGSIDMCSSTRCLSIFQVLCAARSRRTNASGFSSGSKMTSAAPQENMASWRLIISEFVSLLGRSCSGSNCIINIQISGLCLKFATMAFAAAISASASKTQGTTTASCSAISHVISSS